MIRLAASERGFPQEEQHSLLRPFSDEEVKSLHTCPVQPSAAEGPHALSAITQKGARAVTRRDREVLFFYFCFFFFFKAPLLAAS